MHAVDELLHRAADAKEAARGEHARQPLGNEAVAFDEELERPEGELAVIRRGETDRLVRVAIRYDSRESRRGRCRR